MKMLIALVVSLSSLAASAQTRMQWNAEEKAFFDSVRNTIDRAIPELQGFQLQQWIFERTSFPTEHGFDTATPFTCQYRYDLWVDSTKRGWENGIRFSIYVNPKREAIRFDVTKDFEVLDIEGAKHGVRGNQHFVQTADDNRYGDPFTALFLGKFTMPYNERHPQREGGGWGPEQFITTTTYSAYDVSKHYLDVQGIYILFTGPPELADMIIEQIDFAALNRLIEKH